MLGDVLKASVKTDINPLIHVDEPETSAVQY
jgi:hypothetical protein